MPWVAKKRTHFLLIQRSTSKKAAPFSLPEPSSSRRHYSCTWNGHYSHTRQRRERSVEAEHQYREYIERESGPARSVQEGHLSVYITYLASGRSSSDTRVGRDDCSSEQCGRRSERRYVAATGLYIDYILWLLRPIASLPFEKRKPQNCRRDTDPKKKRN